MLVRWNARPTQINRWFDEARWPTSGQEHAPAAPAADVLEDAKTFIITLELPGVKTEDLAIEVAGNNLVVKGEKKSTKQDQSDRTLRVERRFGSFERTFRLPEQVDTNAIVATAADGILTITLPKAERALTRTIPIQAA
jgi:HSP20 family protein